MHKARSFDARQFKEWNERMAKEFDPDTYHESSSGIVAWIERRRVRTILRFLKARPADAVLEVGVGAGNILERVSAGRRSGIDISTFLLQKARARLGENVELIEGDAEELEKHYAVRSFDRVFSSEVLEHVQHPDRVLGQMAHVLKDDGIAVVSVPNERTINALKGVLKSLGIFRLLFPRMADHMEDEWHLTEFGKPLLARLCERHFIVDRIAAVPWAFLPIRYVALLRPRPSVRNLKDILRCPSCEGALKAEGDSLACSSCAAVYPVEDGNRARFIGSSGHDDGTGGGSFKNFFKRWPRFYAVCFAVVGPALLTGLTSARFVRRFKSGERILHAGAGPRQLPVDTLNLDVLPLPSVDVVADLRELPFADASFDAVTCEQTLEHVSSPHRAAAELLRVTRPGGLIHVAVPFVFPWHPSPSDYSRWTIEGLADLFPECAVVEHGVMAGPFSAFVAFGAAFLATVFSFGLRPLQSALQYLFLIVLAPFKLFDLLYAFLPTAPLCAADVYVVLRKPST